LKKAPIVVTTTPNRNNAIIYLFFIE
jgi:hypothetical protein